MSDMEQELNALRETVTQLARRLRALEDHIEITQLVAEYGPSVDSSAGEATAALWTEDGRFDALPQRRMRGRAEIRDMVCAPAHERMLEGGCSHVLTVPHVVVDGDTAAGRSYALQLRWDAEQKLFHVVRSSANTWRWQRTAAGWRIAERVNANLDGTAGHRQLLAPPERTGSQVERGHER